MKDWASELLRVAWGNGRPVLVESEYCDATDAAGVADWANARTAKNTGKNNANPFMVVENKSFMGVPRPGTHRLGK
jgi:hypothetical protein